MKKILISVLFAGMLVLCGCPMLTKNSIDGGTYKVPKWLTGKWDEVKTSGHPEGYDIEGVKNESCQITGYPFDSTGKRKGDSYRVILSDVGGTVFWNVYEPTTGDEKAGWFLYRFEKISEKEFVLKSVKEYAVAYEIKQEELKAFLLKNKDNPDIYDETEVVHYKKRK